MLNFDSAMMRKGKLLLVCVLLVLSLKSQTIFNNYYGSAACYSEGFSILPNDTGFIVSTSELCLPDTNWTGQLLYLTSSGDSATSKLNVPFNGFMKPTADGNLLLLGGTTAGLIYDTIRIAKVTYSGDTLWLFDIFFPLCRNQVYDMVNTSDGGYAITGIYSTNPCDSVAIFNSWVLKLNASGNELWRKTFGSVGDDQFQVIRERFNGSLVLFGWTTSYSNSADLWMTFVAANGDSVDTWLLDTPSPLFGYGMDIAPNNSGFILNYYSDSVYALRIDTNGTELWRTGIGIPSGGRYHSAQTSSDHRFVLLSCFDSPMGCESHLIKLDTNGTVLWDKTWGGLMRTVYEADSGNFLLAGYQSSFPATPQFHVVRFDTSVLPVPDYPMGLSVADGVTTNSRLYPNPASGMVTIDADVQITSVKCFNTMGILIEQTLAIEGKQQRLNLASWPHGIYLIQVQFADNRSETHRLLINR